VTLLLAGVGVSYGRHRAVDAVDLSAQAREVTGLVGPNGSGKSSLMRAVAGLVAHAGSIDFGSAPRAATRIGHMPQDSALRAALSVFEVVLLGRLQSLALRVAHADLEAARLTLDTLGIAHLAERPIGELSGGQRQLAMLAQVLASDPEVLLLDEPISALDLRHQIEVLDIVGRLTRERGLTTIMVLHDLNAAARHCDAICVLHRGRRIAAGSPAEVITTDLLATVFGIDAIVETARDGRPFVVPLRARAGMALPANATDPINVR
jgi:iron complex transport system ATP-binding protein